ncbi:hypothetical protein OVA24_08970 [Luteolibacter sp. SL250]|uniref:hypothetical protein n=1 Tax=Luteolibacter sp. SL250 TaxID=2995170 RepID=UPI002271DA17|nr:hypothetical protein [Luteolibacter sp. SL250]WAC21514.1 hypothetical protein OVA24_08970 [Luteolibacter sp. SL250]
MKQLLLLLTLALPLQAESRNVAVSFFCLKYVAGQETIHLAKASGSEPVRLSTANMTDPVTIPVESDLAVFHRAPAGDPKAPPAAAAKIRIPATVDKALIILVPAAAGSAEPYQAVLVDHGPRFSLGTYRVVNFSRKAIRGAVGRSYVEAASGGMTDLELKGEAGAVQGVRFEFQDEGRWNRLTETRCAVRKDRRWLLCVYQDPVTRRMNMKSIPDRTLLLQPVSVEASPGETAAN